MQNFNLINSEKSRAVYLFPGQGVPLTGIDKQNEFLLRRVRLADNILWDTDAMPRSTSLEQLWLNGSDKLLMNTRIMQPLYFALSIGKFDESMDAGMPTPDLLAGHSLW